MKRISTLLKKINEIYQIEYFFLLIYVAIILKISLVKEAMETIIFNNLFKQSITNFELKITQININLK